MLLLLRRPENLSCGLCGSLSPAIKADVLVCTDTRMKHLKGSEKNTNQTIFPANRRMTSNYLTPTVCSTVLRNLSTTCGATTLVPSCFESISPQLTLHRHCTELLCFITGYIYYLMSRSLKCSPKRKCNSSVKG